MTNINSQQSERTVFIIKSHNSSITKYKVFGSPTNTKHKCTKLECTVFENHLQLITFSRKLNRWYQRHSLRAIIINLTNLLYRLKAHKKSSHRRLGKTWLRCSILFRLERDTIEILLKIFTGKSWIRQNSIKNKKKYFLINVLL